MSLKWAGDVNYQHMAYTSIVATLYVKMHGPIKLLIFKR